LKKIKIKDLSMRIEIYSHLKFDPETQQKWLAIADLFILQIEQFL